MVLTERQIEVVRLVAAGRTDDEMATALGCAPRTAKAHTMVLRQKLGVKHRRDIPAAFAQLTGIDPYPRYNLGEK